MTLISGYRGLAESFLATFHQAGHRLSILVRREEAVAAVRARYPEALIHVGDLATREVAKSWVDLTRERWGTIDCLINNAAITGPGGKLHEADIDEIEATIRVNLLAPIYVSQLALAIFEKQGHGVLLNLSGGGATTPRPFFSPYAITKCAMVRLTETLAQEYPHLRFYAISPGALRTPMMEGLARMDPAKIGREQQDAVRRCEKGGEDPKKAAELALWLFKEHPEALNGKVISAVWDDYRHAPEFSKETGWWTLRRVDEVCLKNLKSVLSAAD